MDKLLEAVPILPRAMKIEVISTLPAFTNDHDHDDLVDALLPFTQSPELVACVLDTIANLCLPASSKPMKKVLRKARELLGTAEASQMPLITKFLLDCADNDNASAIISDVRTQLTEFLQANEVVVANNHHHNNNNGGNSRNSSAAREERNGYLNAQVTTVLSLTSH